MYVIRILVSISTSRCLILSSHFSFFYSASDLRSHQNRRQKDDRIGNGRKYRWHTETFWSEERNSRWFQVSDSLGNDLLVFKPFLHIHIFSSLTICSFTFFNFVCISSASNFLNSDITDFTVARSCFFLQVRLKCNSVLWTIPEQNSSFQANHRIAQCWDVHVKWCNLKCIEWKKSVKKLLV